MNYSLFTFNSQLIRQYFKRVNIYMGVTTGVSDRGQVNLEIPFTIPLRMWATIIEIIQKTFLIAPFGREFFTEFLKRRIFSEF